MSWMAAVILCGAIGFLLACLGWRPLSINTDLLLKIALAGGCGMGVFSVVYFLALVFDLPHPAIKIIDVAVVGGLLGLLLWLRHRGISVYRFQAKPYCIPSPWITRLLSSAFVVTLAGSSYACLKWLRAEPDGGGWDAFAIWNLHARFLFRGGEHWRNGFSSLIAWSHPDYPLLLPASIAHFWTYMGQESTAVPARIGIVFAFSSLAVLFSAVRILRGTNQALLAGTVLASTPFFIEQGISQYADVPLSFFLLATVALVCLAGYDPESSSPMLALAGLLAGFAAWTKNEGLLFLVAFLIAHTALLLRYRGSRTTLRQMFPMLGGTAPLILLIAYFKIHVASPGDLFSSAHTMLERAVDPARYWLIGRWFAKELFLFGRWALIPATVMLAIYAWVIGRSDFREPQIEIQISTWTLVLAFIGYFAVYLVTPYDLHWHLRFSLNRLFLQLWPSVLLVFFLVVKTPEEISRASVELHTECGS